MRYRDAEFTVLQGPGRQLWKWSFSYEGTMLRGQAGTKAEAVSEAMRAIERALSPKKVRLIRLNGNAENRLIRGSFTHPLFTFNSLL